MNTFTEGFNAGFYSGLATGISAAAVGVLAYALLASYLRIRSINRRLTKRHLKREGTWTA